MDARLSGILALGILAASSVLPSCQDAPVRDMRPCPTLRFEPCDLFEQECQATVYRYSECARAYEGNGMPPVDTITQQQYREELTAQSALSPNSAQARAEARKDRMATKAFQLMGMLSPHLVSLANNDIELQVANTLAYYSIEHKSITLIDHAMPVTPATRIRDQLVLAHEFTHAQQDEAHDLASFNRKYFDRSTDGYYAWRSLVEAEANLSEELVMALDVQLDVSAPELRHNLTGLTNRQLERAMDKNRSYSQSLGNFPYTNAFAFVAERYLAGGLDAVQALYRTPRTTMLDFMRPIDAEPISRVELSWELDEADQDQDLPAIRDRLGAWIFQTALLRQYIAPVSAHALAMAWRGDAFFVQADEDGNDVAALWRVDLPGVPPQTLQDTAALINAVPSPTHGAHTVFVHNEELVWILAEDPQDLAHWLDKARAELNAPAQWRSLRPALNPLPRQRGPRPWISGRGGCALTLPHDAEPIFGP